MKTAACSDTGQVDNTFPGYSTPFIPPQAGLTATLREQHFEALADVYREATGYRGLIDLDRFIDLFALSSKKGTEGTKKAFAHCLLGSSSSIVFWGSSSPGMHSQRGHEELPQRLLIPVLLLLPRSPSPCKSMPPREGHAMNEWRRDALML